jgi:hypothetical protein
MIHDIGSQEKRGAYKRSDHAGAVAPEVMLPDEIEPCEEAECA